MYNQSQPPYGSSFPPCPECHGRRVRATLGREGEWQHEQYPVTGQGLSLLVCTVCGYCALYLKDLPAFHEELQKHPEKFGY